jgi:hypothetical protein
VGAWGKGQYSGQSLKVMLMRGKKSLKVFFKAENKIFKIHPSICLLANGASLNMPPKQSFDFSKLKE